MPDAGTSPAARAAATSELTDEIGRFARLVRMSTPADADPDRSALSMLLPLMRGGPMRLRDLADARGADPSTVSRQAAQLVQAGLIERDADPADGRARQLSLTEAGHAACRRMARARREAMAAALSGWSDAQVATFAGLFREFNACVEAYKQGRHAGTEPDAAHPAALSGQETP